MAGRKKNRESSSEKLSLSLPRAVCSTTADRGWSRVRVKPSDCKELSGVAPDICAQVRIRAAISFYFPPIAFALHSGYLAYFVVGVLLQPDEVDGDLDAVS